MTTTERALARGTAASARQKSTPASDGNPQSPNSPANPPKRKGGPVPGTPSPMRTRLSDELHDDARRRFEQTAEPATHIALDCGVDESVIRRMALREGWVRYVAPPRELPPVATLLAQVEELERATTRMPAPQGDGENAAQDLTQQDATQNIECFIRVVMAHLDEFEAVRRAGRLIAREHLPTARAISTLTEAFNKLQRLRAAQPGQIHDDISDMHTDMPADLDAFRDRLARRIDAFIASRAHEGAAGHADAARTDDAGE